MRWHHNSKINAWNSNSASTITIHELQTDSAFWNSKTFKEPCRFAIFFEKFTGNLSMIITIPRILKQNTSICRNFKLPGPNACPTELLLIRSSMFQVSRLEWRPMFWAIARKKIDQIENWRANSNQVAEASACKEGRNQFRCIIRRLFTFHDVGIESFDTPCFPYYQLHGQRWESSPCIAWNLSNWTQEPKKWNQNVKWT